MDLTLVQQLRARLGPRLCRTPARATLSALRNLKGQRVPSCILMKVQYLELLPTLSVGIGEILLLHPIDRRAVSMQ